MSSTTNVTFSLELNNEDKFVKTFEQNIDKYIELDNSHFNIWKRIKEDNTNKYLHYSTKGAMFSFSFVVNFLNLGSFIESIEELVKDAKENKGLFSFSYALLVCDSLDRSWIKIYRINEEGEVGEGAVIRH